ncbi:MAG: hypothetical protein KAU12_00220 [Candidatus Omnitrophica bacterium]|nr:hypothetical protein [Candidatus Omnitrophota bacterium]
MEHTQIVSVTELEKYADTRESQAVIPRLVYRLVNESISDFTACRIPYGDSINQPGLDGLVETENGFRHFVPKGESFWEIGTGNDPQAKATKDFKKRIEQISAQERQKATYVFVTPRTAGSDGWNEPAQRKWIERRKNVGWHDIKILDGIQLVAWLQEFPAIGKWLLKEMGLVTTMVGLTTPAEHWENIKQLTHAEDPPLPPKIFLVGRDQACVEMHRLFRGEIKQVVLASASEADAMDFVAAFLESLDAETQRHFCNKCLFIKDPDVWYSMAGLRIAHVLVAYPNLDLESSGQQLLMAAKKNGHAVVIGISGALIGESDTIIHLRSPSASILKTTLTEAGFGHDRARELAEAGALSLANLKRYMLGLGELPPYATWKSARALSQAGLLGRWNGGNPADRVIVENIIKNSYGEWIEIVRPETLRSDTPLIQQNENWKMISRGEAWLALCPRLCNDDLDRFQNAVLSVLGEHDPKFELPKEERIAASIHGKVLRHSESLRKGMAETLALLGSRPNALSSCSQGKAELVATLTVRALLKNADWVIWATLGSHLPMLAEAAPDKFLGAVEDALLNPAEGPFNTLFAQEGSGVTGWNYTSGLLWALETLAWHSSYLVRVTMLLGELAAIDPGGPWANRPANSLRDIFLPWHPQTCANIQKRKEAVESLLREQPSVGWKLLQALLPSGHSMTSGCCKPTWRNFIPPCWSEGVTKGEYWDQVSGYAELAVNMAAADIPKLAELIDRLPDLPPPAYSNVFKHLSTDLVLGLAEPDRLPLWEALIDLAAKHRKFTDAKWAMPMEMITKIEEIAEKLAPKSASLIYRRLFSDRDFDLLEEKGDYEEQQRSLSLKRQEAIRAIIKEIEVVGVLDFAQQVASPEKVGHALGCIELEAVDISLLPGYLEKEDRISKAFIGGFVWGRFWTKSWPWVDDMIKNAWTIQQKATFLSLLPFSQDTWSRAEKFLGNDKQAYWEKANVNPWGKQEHLLEAVNKLLEYGRPKSALACLNRLIHDKITFPPDIAVRSLMDTLTTEKNQDIFDRHDILKLIKWLQNNPSTDPNALFRIEWNYLPFLDHEFGGVPKTLEFRLASDPTFFCEVIGIVFRSDKDERKEQPSEKQRNIAQNAYRLFSAWKTVPGTSSNGSFDGKAFTQWVAEVKKLATASGHFGVAMSQIGQVLPYSLSDPSGLWIHSSVAEILNNKDAVRMRSGFTTQLFNMRGVHGFSAGKKEREIAAHSREKAEALEHHGYHRFATAMRKFAASYERKAERENTRDPFED